MITAREVRNWFWRKDLKNYPKVWLERLTAAYKNILEIEYPSIPSAGVYYFTTKSGLRYEVRFGRLQDNILHANIVFGVIDDEFEGEEYVTTNRGEVFTVMNTIVEIVKNYMKEHPKVNIYEFNAVG